MWKLLCLAIIGFFTGLLPLEGLYALLAFFFFMLYSFRYRVSHAKKMGKLLGKDSSSKLSLVDMGAQGDLLPVPLWSDMFVVKKWRWDQLVVDTAVHAGGKKASDALSTAHQKLVEWTGKAKPSGTGGPYKGTLAVIDPDHRWDHTPTTALSLLEKCKGEQIVWKGLEAEEEFTTPWTNKAICTLGGTFVICAEAYKGAVKLQVVERRMEASTIENSRLTWKAGQLWLAPLKRKGSAIFSFVNAVFQRILPWDKHAIIQYKGSDYYAPTTMFGASATMMKVMSICEAIGLSDEDKVFVGYAVVMHWIDKYLNDNSWFDGGVFTPDRHSLIEGLQGMYAFIEKNPQKAATELVTLYENTDKLALALQKDKNL